MSFLRKISLFFLFTLLLTSCFQDPFPNFPLTKEEMIADIKTVFGHYRTNYALLPYKLQSVDYRAEHVGLKGKKGLLFRGPHVKNINAGEWRAYKSINQLESKVTRMIESGAITTQRYPSLVQEVVASMEDAHNSFSYLPNNMPPLPGYQDNSQLAYVGVFVERRGENALVKEIHPLMSASDEFIRKIAPGDEITHVNGMTIRKYINTEISRFRSLGKEESNMDFLINSIFNRSSLRHELPAVGSDLVVTIKDKGDLVLPWKIRSYSEFNYKLNELKENPFKLNVRHKPTGKVFPMVFVQSNGYPVNLYRAMGLEKEVDLDNPRKSRLDFMAFNEYSTISTNWQKYEARLNATGRDILENEGRYIPENALFLSEANTYPAYVYVKRMPDGTTKNVGYIRIGTFSPQAPEEIVMAELYATLNKFQSMKVENIVVDTMDNPGGSLRLVNNVIQAFSKEKIETIGMRFGINRNWLSDFQSMSMALGMDSESEIARRVFDELVQDYEAGKKMSTKTYKIDSLMGFMLEPNKSLSKDLKLIFLANHGNASSGDISTYTAKINKLGPIVGWDTMGAGGNVVKKNQTPFSHGEMRVTESALVKNDGTFIENNGVQVDVKTSRVFDRTDGYATIIESAFAIVGDDANLARFIQLTQLENKVKYFPCIKHFLPKGNSFAAKRIAKKK